MKTWITALSLALVGTAVLADNDAWITVSSTKKHLYEVKRGSFERTTNKAGEEIGLVIARQTTQLDDPKQITLEKWYVRASECQRGMGKLVTLTLSGEFSYENDFIIDGGTVASANAQAICDVLQMNKEAARKKGV
jgi:hypothetical protein